MKEEKVEKIKLDISEEEIENNLENYRELAIKSGASDSKIIKTTQLTVDERVKLKCEIPKCYHFGNCVHCPPHSMPVERTRRILSLFENAIIFKIDIPANVIVRNDKEQELTVKRVMAYRKITEICNKIESTAFYNGNYLSVAFAAGSCRGNFCYNSETCAVLENRPCVHYYRTRPSMESVGIDCYKLATELGWDILPIGNGAKLEHISHGILMGLVLIS